MRKNNGRLLLVLLPALLVVGISRNAFGQTTPNAPAALEGATWVLQSYGDAQNPTAVLAGTKITARFDGTAHSVTGIAGCNQYFAGYQAESVKLTVGSVGTTKKFCGEPAGVMDQEQQYLALLQSVTQYRLTGEQLELLTADGSRLLRYSLRK